MASKTLITLLVVLSIAFTFTTSVVSGKHAIDSSRTFSMTKVLDASGTAVALPEVGAPPSKDECDICINVAVELINVLLNFILNGGIISDCGSLCGQLNNNLEDDICDAICDVVGIDEFVKILEKFSYDIDPIYFCQLVFMCDVQDCTGQCASLVDLVVDPQIGSVDTTFYINATMVIYQPIGAGVIDWTWTSVQDPSFSTGYQALVTSFEQGSYLLSLEEYPAGYGGLQPGNYTVQIDVCEGLCGATFPHTALLASANSWMMITEN